MYEAGMSKLKRVVLVVEIVAEKEFPNAVSGASGEVGTMRCGNWKFPEEISAGHVDGVREVGIEELEVFTGYEGVARLSAALQPSLCTFNSIAWHPVLSGAQSV